MTRARKTRTSWGKIKTLPSGRYWAAEPVGGGKYIPAPKTFTSRAAAEKWLRQREEDRDGKATIPKAMLLDSTFGWWLERWLMKKERAWSAGRMSAKAYAAYEGNVRNWIMKVKVGNRSIMEIPIRKIDAEMIPTIQEALKAMVGPRKRRSPSQAHKAELNMYSVFKLAATEGAIPSNPFRDDSVYISDLVLHRDQLDLTKDMVTLIADHIPINYRAAVFLWAYGGLRSGEAWGLQPADINVLTRRVALNRSMTSCPDKFIRDTAHVYKTGHAHPMPSEGPWECACPYPEIPFGTRMRIGVQLGPVKTRRVKTIDVQQFVANELQAHLDRRKPEHPNDWLFVDDNGLPVNHGTFYSYVFKPLLRMLELPESIVVHSLRHFCGSYHLLLGYPPFVVKEMLGHTDAEMTRLYSHLLPGSVSEWHARADADYAKRMAT